MNLTERLISTIAPHICLGCQKEGSVLCNSCRLSLLPSLPSRCYRCHKVTVQSQTCQNCRRFGLTHAWVVTDYEGIAKDVVYKLKFGRVSAASKVIAKSMADILPQISEATIVTFVPTAPSRIRVRGYDQAKLIAKDLSKRKNLDLISLLERKSMSRQVGSSRKDRFKQLEGAFQAKNLDILKNSEVLLIDDVLTTGATLESAAKVLKQAGAKRVNAAVFAQS